MPFYEYECSACKFYVEALQKVTDAPMVKCPSCGKDSLQRLISAPVFRLKGSGWYETDFKSDKENKRNLADDKEPAASSDSDDKKVKVRASKALTKAQKALAAKKSAKKKAVAKPATGKSVARKTTKAPVVKKSGKSVKKAPKKDVKKPARKVASPAAGKAAKKAAKKKAPARKK